MTTRKLTVATLAFLALSAAPAHAAQPLDVTGQVRLLPGGGSTLRQTGSFNGTPLGSGTINVTTNVGRGQGAVVSFRMFNRRGQIWGSGDVKLTFRGAKVSYAGSARITGGSGAFSRIRSTALRISGAGELSGSRFPLRLTGTV
jgi:hypothetical protein